MILVDANVMMYAAGTEHPNNQPSVTFYPALMARDALHAAVVQVNALAGICSFDHDFDLIDGVERIQPS